MSFRIFNDTDRDPRIGGDLDSAADLIDEFLPARADDLRVDQYRAVGTVGQGFHHRQRHRSSDPPQQVSPGFQGLRPEPEAVEIPVCDHQHIRLESSHKVSQQSPFILKQRTERRGNAGMRATFFQRDHTNLGKRASFRAVIQAAELDDVIRRVGHVEHKSVDRHQSPRSQPGSFCS